ncbi:HIT family protein [Streptococcus caprae]|uniref:HIT family protein n=1 Tax=Streptococcus caprae TaxID=1640501 RepID=A0ABV8CUC0_9STRE
MENCIFCKIVAGEIPSSKVYEDEDVLAFLDISQATPGHTLVIPKEHVRNVLDMSADTAQSLFARVPKIARGLQKATGADGMNIINNNEEAAGQTVFHAHIHLLPRYADGDELDIRFTAHEPDFPALAALAQSISQEVQA